MAQNSSSSPSQTAAVRVQHCLGREKRLSAPLKLAPQKTKEFYAGHRYVPVKLPRALSLMDRLRTLARRKEHTKPLQARGQVPAKPFGITVNQPPHIHQKDLQFFQMDIALLEAVVLCLHKEHLLATNRLKSLSRQEGVGTKKHQIVSLKPSPEGEQKEQPADFPPGKWERFKEERQFQISRM